MPLKRIEALLSELEDKGQLRLPEDGELRGRVAAAATGLGVPFVDLCSNDYLGFASGGLGLGGEGAEVEAPGPGGAGDVSRETSLGSSLRPSRVDSGSEVVRAGAGASRLLGGTHPEHLALESQLAEWVGQPEALLFSSGYAANLGLLSSLPQAEDLVLSDSLNHASIIDGCRLSRARVGVYAHKDLQMLESMLRDSSCEGEKWVVSETYFSMDGDSPDLPKLRALCDRYQAGLILDEAHALGVFGLRGAGLAAGCGVAPDVFVGAFGKALGLQGAFVAGPGVLKRWLWNKARSFVFSTAPTPALAAQQLFHVKQVQLAESRRRRLFTLVDRIRAELVRQGLPVAQDSFGPIIPILIGDSHRSLELAEQLRARGVLVYPVRPPTVPEGTARLRLTVTAAITDESLSHLFLALDSVLHSVPSGSPRPIDA
jgi:8-amino-7-oxononanoate synthase